MTKEEQQAQGNDALSAGSQKPPKHQFGRKHRKPELVIERTADADPTRPYELVVARQPGK